MMRRWRVVILSQLIGLMASAAATPMGASSLVYNAVLVDPTSTGYRDANGNIPAPFYISIFEVSCGEAREVLGIKFVCDSREVIAQIGSQQSQEYCQRLGGRLPTQEEWLMAASGLGQNKNYSLIDDGLVDSQGHLLANVYLNRAQRGYLAPTEFRDLGIDIMATVGMTGNEEEYVQGSLTCGGAFHSSASALGLSSAALCTKHGSEYNTRCVFDAIPDTQPILDSSVVKGELRQYIEFLENARQRRIRQNKNNGSTYGSRAPVFVSPVELAQIKTLNQKIDTPKDEPNPIEYIMSFIHAPPAAMTDTQNYREITFGDSTNAKSADPTQRLAPPPCYDEEFDDIRNFDDTGLCNTSKATLPGGTR